MLKILIIALFIGFVIRYIARSFLRFVQSNSVVGNKPTGNLIQEEIVPCPACGTYNPKSHALFKGGHYYCSEPCFHKENNK